MPTSQPSPTDDSTSDATTRPRLLLLDGHSVAYRAFYALPVENFATQTGQHTNAVFGFTSMLINVLRDEVPTHVGVAFDVSRQTFRTEAFPEYKAQRSASPDEFRGQVSLIKEVLAALNIPAVELEGFEADDIIATLSTQAADQGMEVLICSGDRDAMQLVNPQVTVLYPRKGVSDLARMTPDAVAEKYLVPPEVYPELAALVGESSDNLPGVPKVGPKTAAKWLKEYEGLDNLLDHADQIKGVAGQNLRDNIEQVRMNRRLNALVTDLDLPLGPQDLTRQMWDRQATHELFDALEFRVLRERLLELTPEEAEPEGGFELTGERLAAGTVAGWLAEHAPAGAVTGVDVLGHWGSGTGDPTAIALASTDGAAGWVDVTELAPADEDALADWLADPGRPKAMHSAKGPLLALWERGWELAGLISDTELAAYILMPDQRTYDLADLTVRYLKRELRLEEDGGAGSEPATLFDDPAHDPTHASAMIRARAVIDLAEAMQTELADRSQEHLLTDIELPLQQTLARMERLGVAIDTDHLEQLESHFDARVTEAADAAYAVLGKEINLGSPKQLQVVLFDELGLKKTRRTKSGYTTDAAALQQLYADTEHPFLAHLLAHRDNIKLRQTIEGLLKAVADDGRVHTTYLQTIAATGRLSSTDPNLQNIPIRTEEGRRIREAFVPGPRFESLMSADYSQIEMRLMAHMSGDEGLIEAFRSGTDFHTVTASRVFGVDPSEVTSDMRSKVKAMNYGLAYGQTVWGLRNNLRISAEEAQSLMDGYFERFGGVREYLADIVKQARRSEYTETILGRRRYLPDLMSSNRQRRENAERMALNAPIQGSAADVIKVAMLDVESALAASGLKSRMLLQIHDELLFEVAPGEEEQLGELVHEKMENAVDLAVPMDVSIGIGENWHAAAH
ncbi:DNA polymerase I [Granulicoccus phenolivorans]|uniref:DNA polymerase I n=1 Tax=Granulicoccus phenolivorans TaxID=266854 RepID=UPI00042173B7|nr:DNA polymerase I [Granulicoccus phenolivorans]